MRFSRRYGKYCPGLYFIGIVFDGDTLQAEFGPKKFQTKTDNFLSTACFTLLELQNVLDQEDAIPLKPNEKKNYLRQIRKAREQIETAIVGLHEGKVWFDDFLPPEPPLNIAPLADRVDNNPRLLAAFVNCLARLQGTAEMELAPEEQKLADQFHEVASDFEMNRVINRKSLPPILLPKLA